MAAAWLLRTSYVMGGCRGLTMDAALLADSHAGWKGVVIKMSMSGMCFSSSAVPSTHSQVSQQDRHIQAC